MITLTSRAAEHVREMLRGENGSSGLCLRLGIQHGGCSGFSYTLGFDEQSAEDLKFVSEQVPIIVDKAAESLLSGTVIDYEDGDLGGGFSINNPNASLTCGCGSSFRTKDRGGKPKEC